MSEATLQARLAALRATGGLDAARMGTLEALARRMDAQPPAVRQVLAARLAAALTEQEGRLAAAPAPASSPLPSAAPPRPALALAALNAHLREAAVARLAAAAPGEPAHEDELASARRFGQAWQARRTVEQVAHALQRRPSNAGPLNSHALVLHSLALMRELSPAYLRRFLAQVEALQWLEQARDAQAGPAKRAQGTARRRPRG